MAEGPYLVKSADNDSKTVFIVRKDKNVENASLACIVLASTS